MGRNRPPAFVSAGRLDPCPQLAKSLLIQGEWPSTLEAMGGKTSANEIGGNHSTMKVSGKVDQAESLLRKALERGRWNDKLPGVRALADTLGVSGGTLTKALRRLEKSGDIASSGPKSRYRIHRVANDAALAEGHEMTVLVLIPKEVGKNAAGAHWHLVARLSELLAPKRWKVRSHVVNMGGEKMKTRAWDRLLSMEAPDAVIAILGTRNLAKWAAARDLRMLFCGGTSGKYGFPVVGVSTADMVEVALGKLLDRGHERVCFPLCGRTFDFHKAVRMRVRSVFASRGIRFQDKLHLPQAAGRNSKDLRRLFLRTDAAFGPTAWICLDWVEFLWVKRQLEFLGRDIPADVSLVCLSSDDAIDWIEPPPSHFEHPLEKLSQEMAKWVKRPSDHVAGASISVTPAWIPGKTLGAVRK